MALDTGKQWQAAIGSWVSSKNLQRLAPTTQDQLAKQVKAFARAIAPLGPWQIKPAHVSQWLNQTTTTAPSRYHRKAALRNFYKWAKQQGRIANNPAQDNTHPLAAPIPRYWQEPLRQFSLWQKSRGQSDNTNRQYNKKLMQLANETGASTPWQLDAADLAEWIGGHKWSRETSRQSRTVLRTFYFWAEKYGHISNNPAAELDPVKTTQGLPRPASESDYSKALAESGPRVSLMLRLSAELGLRRGEVAALHTSDLNPDSYGGYWLDVLGKGGKRRAIPVPDDLATIIRQRPQGWLFPNGKGTHLSAQHVGKLVAKALPNGVTMHQLRHRFATRAYQARHDIYAVQHLLGHASPTTTQRYVALDLNQLRDVINAVASQRD